MFANRYTAFVDACVLVGVLKRNLLLTLAEAEFFRLRWSQQVLDETSRAIQGIALARRLEDVEQRAERAIASMIRAFPEAMVDDYDTLAIAGAPRADADIPDPDDAHVVAAALKAQAAVIVTDNLKHFPGSWIGRLNMEARSANDFIADTIALDTGKAVAAIRRMRERYKNPTLTGNELLLRMEAVGLLATVDILRSDAPNL